MCLHISRMLSECQKTPKWGSFNNKNYVNEENSCIFLSYLKRYVCGSSSEQSNKRDVKITFMYLRFHKGFTYQMDTFNFNSYHDKNTNTYT